MKKLNTKLRFLPICMVLLFLVVQTAAFDVMSDSFVRREAEQAIDAVHMGKKRKDVLRAELVRVSDGKESIKPRDKKLFNAIQLYTLHNEDRMADPDSALYRTSLAEGTYYYKIYENSIVFVYTQYIQTIINNIYLAFFVAMVIFAVFVQVTGSGLTLLLRRDFAKLQEGIDRLSRDAGPGKYSFYNVEFEEIYEVVQQMEGDLAEAEESEKRFFQNASHELRTPLMSIQGYAEGLELDVFKDPREALQIIYEEEQNMSALVEELLLLSQVDLEDMPEDMTDVWLNELVPGAMAKVQGVALQKGIILRPYLQKTTVPIHGNRAQLERSITNLLTNALRFAEAEIKVRLYTEGKQYIIEVADDGPGIQEEDLPHVFERFYKGSKGSFGIGLSLSQEIIKRCFGTIEARNTPDGALFRICLPVPRRRWRRRQKKEFTQ